jgi:hypothetical protein
MRARNIKPSFFTNEALGVLDPIIQLTFAGLWCLADRDGILEDRPLRIKAELFPYREGLDMDGFLTVLEKAGFIERYTVHKNSYIYVIAFSKHQSPHKTENAKNYPRKPLNENDNAVAPLSNGELTVTERPDSLIHGFTDSLIPDSKSPTSAKRASVGIDVWRESLGDELAIPENDPIFDYAEKTGIPIDFLELSWKRFVEDMRERGTRKKDWRMHYRNAVRGNWFKLWWFDGDGVCRLTTTGEQARRAAA